MKFSFILFIYLSFAYISAQTSNIDIDGNSSIMLLDNNSICADVITVQNGSSFTAEYYGNVLIGNCTTVLTPGGGGNITLPVEITDIESLPTQFTIEPAFPNPFNPSTTMKYGIPIDSEVTILIYDIMGRKLASLFKDVQQAGWYEIIWNGALYNGEIAPTGVYVIKLISINGITGQEIRTSKISLVK